MAISRQKKEDILKSLKDDLKQSEMTVFVNFHGLDVQGSGSLRRSLRGVGSKLSVAKKTLIKKACEDAKYEGELPSLDGELAVAYSSDDIVAPAKELKTFAKEGSIKILGGIFEGKFIDDTTVMALADIPSREVLLGQFVNVINSPIQGTVSVLNGVLRNFVGALDAISRK